jgi:cytochrome P450
MNQSSKPAPGPRGAPFLGNTLAILRQGQVRFQLEQWARYGDLFRYSTGPYVAHTIVRPTHVRHVLAQARDRYEKGPGYTKTRELLGAGLLTSEGDLWQRQRRLMQPPFTHKAVTPYAPLMVAATIALLDRWAAQAQQNAVVEIHREMTRLTLNIIGQTMFRVDVGERGTPLVAAYSETSTYINRRLTSFFELPLAVPTPANRRYEQAVRTLDELVYGLIAERRSQPTATDDLLTRLLAAQDEASGQRMSDKQVRDELMTIFFAGHETMAQALTWTWWLLAHHPTVAERLMDEVDQVLGGRAPTAHDLPKLPYTQMVLQESMRLYPPVWIFPRAARCDDEIDGYAIPAGSLIFPCPLLTHRHPEFWPEPARFDPERFAPPQVETRPAYAYYPFGGGPRLCIGANFAQLEGPLILATIAQRFRLRLVDSTPVLPKSVITLHPDRPIPLRLEPRRG